MKPSNRSFPCVLAIEYYLIVCAVSVLCLLSRTHGRFAYPLDDTYISMAIAKNMAQHGVMGLTRHGFTFSTSCPLWITLMAVLDRLAGAVWWIPLAMSLVAGVVALIVASRVLRSHGVDGAPAVVGLLAVCIFTPLPAMGLSGMEHALHITLVLSFVAGASRFLERHSLFPSREFLKLTAILIPMVMLRYESLFLASLFALLLLVRRRWQYAALTMVSALGPVGVLGFVSVVNGWQWLPNSLLLKGNVPDLSSLAGILNLLGGRSLWLLFGNSYLVGFMSLLLVTAIWRAARGESFWSRGQLLIFFAVAGTLIHLQLADVGWFFRYEAYLIALGVTALFANRLDLLVLESLAAASRLLRIAAAVLLLLAIAPLAGRTAESVAAFPRSAYTIYEQQYQMALFVTAYYDGASIAANDVGAINFMTDLRCLDLVGLCNREIFLLRRRHAYDSQAMKSQAEAAHVRIAIVYDTWFDGRHGPRIPSTWTRVGRWHIKDNEYLGGDTVSFYAVDPQETEYLIRSLHDFSARLPTTVEQTGSYLTAQR